MQSTHVLFKARLIYCSRYTKQGSLKDHTDCAPNNGYYFLPFYDKGEYVLKVSISDWSQHVLVVKQSSRITFFVCSFINQLTVYSLHRYLWCRAFTSLGANLI